MQDLYVVSLKLKDHYNCDLHFFPLDFLHSERSVLIECKATFY